MGNARWRRLISKALGVLTIWQRDRTGRVGSPSRPLEFGQFPSRFRQFDGRGRLSHIVARASLPALGLLNRKRVLGDSGDVIPIESRNERGAHFSGTNRFAFVMISAVSKSELIHLPDHRNDSFVPFRLTLRQ